MGSDAIHLLPGSRIADDCKPVLGEITYGLERLAMYLQGVENVHDLVWAEGPACITYGVYHQNEVEQSGPTSSIPTSRCCSATSANTSPKPSA